MVDFLERRRTIGNRIAPPRFIMFACVLVAMTVVSSYWFAPSRGFIVGFDAAAIIFLISLLPLLRAQTPETIRDHANANDANRFILLLIASIVSGAILAAMQIETSSRHKPDVPLIIGTLIVAWLFANTIYALHYAHMYYYGGSDGGLDFSGDPDCPDYSDFIYFSFTLGMTFQTSDTAVVSRHMRQVVTLQSLTAFIFNIGILAFTINTIGGK